MKTTLHHIARLAVTIAMATLGSCADDQPERQWQTVELRALSPSFLLVEPVTRAVAWPTGYYDYSDVEAGGDYALQAPMLSKTIGACFTQGTTESYNQFAYNSTEHRWHTTADLTEGTYQLYGFIPAGDVLTHTISPVDGDFANGATLTLTGLKAVTASDVCIIVGAKEGTGPETVEGLATGRFQTVIGESGKKYLFLLFDHLYAGVRFSFKVDAGYAALRTVKLKKLEMTATAPPRVNAVVRIEQTDNGSTPVKSVAFSDYEGSTQFTETIYSGDDITLTTSPSLFKACFVPQTVSSFRIRSTYDVYDRRGNLIRQNCTAENAVSLGEYIHLARGRMFTVNMTVNPTYLYMLSDPDLDNPTVKIEN